MTQPNPELSKCLEPLLRLRGWPENAIKAVVSVATSIESVLGEKLLTTAEVEARYGVRSETLTKLVRDGAMVPVQHFFDAGQGARGSYLFSPKGIEDWLGKNTTERHGGESHA